MALKKEILDALIAEAKKAAAAAYCPYSNFAVGVALLTPSGRIFSGCNVENVVNRGSVCAEQSAVSAMVTAGEREIDVVLVYTPTGAPTTPCGICRQLLWEFAPNAKIISAYNGPETAETTLAALLPNAFGPKVWQAALAEKNK